MPTCPNCKTGHLVRSERSGAESNYCPECRSWIDEKGLTEGAERDAQAQREKASKSHTRPPPPPAEDAQVKKNM
jgi:Zn-finger nucleic acid-binding protein